MAWRARALRQCGIHLRCSAPDGVLKLRHFPRLLLGLLHAGLAVARKATETLHQSVEALKDAGAAAVPATAAAGSAPGLPAAANP